jgi:hypothetical protein
MEGRDRAVGLPVDHSLLERRVSWDAYYPNTVCHYEGEIVDVAVRDDGTMQLLVQITDSMGNIRLKEVAAEEVKVIRPPNYSSKTNLIVDRLGRMGVIVTGEVRDAIEEIIGKNG